MKGEYFFINCKICTLRLVAHSSRQIVRVIAFTDKEWMDTNAMLTGIWAATCTVVIGFNGYLYLFAKPTCLTC